MTAVTESDWTAHVSSRKHKKAVSSFTKRALNGVKQAAADLSLQDKAEEQGDETVDQAPSMDEQSRDER